MVRSAQYAKRVMKGLERHRKMVEAFTGFAVSRYTTRINVAPKEYRRFITEAKAECIYHL